MHGLFLIRKNRLNLSIVMRSNDLVKGLVYDLPFFVSLMEQMVNELASTYPDLEVGQYRHLSHSMHLYESDIDKVRAMLGLRVLPVKDRPAVQK
jgi:thymidylate synthase